jgi:hypothetical protein
LGLLGALCFSWIGIWNLFSFCIGVLSRLLR